MSPAPTRTGSSGAEGGADSEPGPPDALAIARLAAADVWRVAVAPSVAPGLPADRLTRLANPKSRIRVALKATTPSPTDRAIVRGPGGRGSSLIAKSLPPRLGDGGDSSFETVGGGVAQQTVEVPRGIGDEVDIERAHALLEDAPHRLAEIGDHAHQRQPGEAGGHDRAVVGRQQDLVLVGGQLVVDAEVAEVEERVAHPRV